MQAVNVQVDARTENWHAGVDLDPDSTYIIEPSAGDRYTLTNGAFYNDFHGWGEMDGHEIGIPKNPIRLGGLTVLVTRHQSEGYEILDVPPGTDRASVRIGAHGGSMAFVVADKAGTYADNSGICNVTVRKADKLTAFASRDEMEFTVTVSRTGIVETERYAGIKRQDGTYHHDFWFSIQDANLDTIWAMTDPLTLTIGAANDTWDRPSFVSKRERAVFNIPADKAQALASIAIYLYRRKTGSGSLIDIIEQADRIYKRLKDNSLVKDTIQLVTELVAA